MYITAATALLFAVIGLGIAAFLRLKKHKSPVYLLFFTIFYVYLYNVLDYTLFQYQSLLILKYFNPGLMLRGQAPGETLNLIPLVTLIGDDLKTSLLNILLMVPFGFGLPFVTRFRMKGTVVAAALFSVTIETVQLVTGLVAGMTFRVADINDVIFNTLGAAFGYMLCLGFLRLCRQMAGTMKLKNSVMKYITDRPQIPRGR